MGSRLRACDEPKMNRKRCL